MSYEPEMPPQEGPSPSEAAARQRVSTPAVFLIIVGILNALLALFLLYVGYSAANVPPEARKQIDEQVERELAKQPPEQQRQMREIGYTGENILLWTNRVGLWGGLIGLLACLLTILGGVRMLSLRSYGLAVFGALLAAVPCVSPSSCCVLGMVAGFWSLAVLMNADVKAAFR